MAYTPINWQTGDTITAEKLNRCDNGWGASTTTNELYSGSMTVSAGGDGGAVIQAAIAEQLSNASQAVITIDGTSYTCDGFDDGGFWTFGAPYNDYSVIRAGIIQDILAKNSWNLETGEFNLTNARINITSATAYDDLIVLKYSNNEITIAPEEVALVDTQAEKAAIVTPDGITAYPEFVPGVTEKVGAEFTSDGIKLYDNDDRLRASLDLTDGLTFYNVNGTPSAQIPPSYRTRTSLGTVSPYNSRGTVDSGGFYRLGSQCNINFLFTSSYSATNTPRITGMSATPQITSPLQAYDLTANAPVGCYVNTSGNIFLSTAVSGHQYAIGGTFII